MNTSLRITEIFYSLQGESTLTGLPTVFIRLTGCPLRCQYCDTAYAFHGGKRFTLTEILEQVSTFDCKTVCVTGGEPLAQKNVFPLLTALLDTGYRVSLETSGALSLEAVDKRTMIIMDIKTPESQESTKNNFENLAYLKQEIDQIKFVLCSRADYDWAVQLIREKQLDTLAHLLFSPSYETLAPHDLASWILADKLPVRMQIQLHKLLWQNEPGR